MIREYSSASSDDALTNGHRRRIPVTIQALEQLLHVPDSMRIVVLISRKRVLRDVHPELAVALELTLTKPLIGGIWCGNSGMRRWYSSTSCGSSPVIDGLEVNQIPLLVIRTTPWPQRLAVFGDQSVSFAPWKLQIVDPADYTMRLAEAGCTELADAIDVDIDLDAKISTAPTHKIAEIFANEFSICPASHTMM